eukprot:scaffold1455_cov87-Cyclotella_meneghiniana.AAC.5
MIHRRQLVHWRSCRTRCEDSFRYGRGRSKSNTVKDIINESNPIEDYSLAQIGKAKPAGRDHFVIMLPLWYE